MLTDHSLRYYKDSIAEEVSFMSIFSPYSSVAVSSLCLFFHVSYLFRSQASDLDGEIDLCTCYNVTEYQAQRNYGFQIHVRVPALPASN